MPRVSVVIPTYNCAEYLDDSMSSVLNQTFWDLELIVIDNGSDDDTKVVVSQYLKNPRVKYIRMPLRNVSEARNIGVMNAFGEYIAFLDADDIFLKDKIEKQVRILDGKKQYGLCYANEVYFKAGTDKEVLSTYYHFSGDVFYYLKRNDFIHTSTVMARKGIIEENPFDETLTSHEDWDIFLRLAAKGYLFAYIDEPLVRVRIRDTSATRNKEVMDMTRREVGQRARKLWKELKKSMTPLTPAGQKAIGRYMKFKVEAPLIGFPRNERYNKPIPQELI